MSTPPRTCVVGAGPAGLALARAFRAEGLPVTVVERHAEVGGIWEPDNPGTPLYDSAHFISSRTQSAYPGFPMPDDWPDYPSRRQILSYLQAFADTYGLREVVRTGTSVEAAVFDGAGWDVTTRDVGTGETATERFDHLVAANGTQWEPAVPDVPGTFDGEMLHAQSYWSPRLFDGRRVLVVGAGNSGVDIACDAARNASATFLSLRRGYHVVPKHLLGKPVDVIAAAGPLLPARLEQAVLGRLLRTLNGSPESYGLPTPDHRLLETHPIINSEILGHLTHGRVAVRGDVAAWDGDGVRFRDGTREQVDVVVLATGYTTPIPYAGDEVTYRHGRPQLFLHTFSRTNPRLHAVGFTEGDGAAYTLFDHQATAVASLVRMTAEDPARAARWQRYAAHEQVDLTHGTRLIDTPRHANYLNVRSYLTLLEKVSRRWGWTAPDPARYQPQRRSARVAVPA